MTLSDAQIDRYSRQIILPDFGGLGQERLLAAKLAVAGDLDVIEPALRYLVGAGIGHLDVYCVGEQGRRERVFQRLTELNPGVRLGVGDGELPSSETVFLAISNDPTLEFARNFADRARSQGVVVVRLSDAPRIAVLPSPRPCISCADDQFLGAIGPLSPIAQFALMLATTECLKLLLSKSPSSPSVITFRGLETTVRPASSQPKCSLCD